MVAETGGKPRKCISGGRGNGTSLLVHLSDIAPPVFWASTQQLEPADDDQEAVTTMRLCAHHVTTLFVSRWSLRVVTMCAADACSPVCRSLIDCSVRSVVPNTPLTQPLYAPHPLSSSHCSVTSQFAVIPAVGECRESILTSICAVAVRST